MPVIHRRLQYFNNIRHAYCRGLVSKTCNMKNVYTNKMLLTGLLLAGSLAGMAQRPDGRGGGPRGEARQGNPGRSQENRQREFQRPQNDNRQREFQQRQQNDNRQREWQQRQNTQRSTDIQRQQNDNRQREIQQRQQNDSRQREWQQRQDVQRSAEAQRQRDVRAQNDVRQRDRINNDRQRQWQQQQSQSMQRRDMQRGGYDRQNDIRRQQARVNRPAPGGYNRMPSFRNRTYAYGYRPRYTRPPVIWAGRSYYTNYNYYYHPYRPRIYGSFFHPVGYFRVSLGAAAISVLLNGSNYWYDQGVFYEPYNNGYQVISAPGGAYISQLPAGYTTVELAGNLYYYFAGTFYATSAQGFVVTDAPPGAIVYDLPEGCSEVQVDGMTYLEYNGTYFQPIMIDGRDAYEVVALDEEEY